MLMIWPAIKADLVTIRHRFSSRMSPVIIGIVAACSGTQTMTYERLMGHVLRKRPDAARVKSAA